MPVAALGIFVTAFYAVYDATTRIPRGKVSTYALVAQAIGCKAPRAVISGPKTTRPASRT